jgi:regulator of sigma E protease
MEFLQVAWAVVLIVFFFGGSIFVHELGHYLAARRRGLKVERFSIGFGPKIWSTQRDGVEWCISLFPLGGYVALPQLANLEGAEGEYKSDIKTLPPISYTDTVVVAVMGVVFNLIFAFVLASILWVIGKPTTDSQQTTVVGTVLTEVVDAKGDTQTGPGLKAGLQPGDKILKIDGLPVRNWRDIKQYVITGSERAADGSPRTRLSVEREGKTVELVAYPLLTGGDKLRSLGVLPKSELIVGKIFKNSPAEAVGLMRSDEILAINATPIWTYYDYTQLMEKNGAQPLILSVRRGETVAAYSITPKPAKVNKAGESELLLGFEIEPKSYKIYQDPLTQIADAASLTWRTLTTLINPDSDIKLNHLSGPPGIAWAIYRLSFDFSLVLAFIVVINVNLAILNMLPLPVLDGGHIVLATIGKLMNKPVSGKLVGQLQSVFTLLLMGLMVYIIFFSDVPRLKREWKEEQQVKQEIKERITPVFE